jgi:hypothetical protein
MANLSEDGAYKEQHQRCQRSLAVAHFSQRKAEQALKDRQVKGKPYEQTRLFMYLWKRRFRFPEYRANNLIRTLDGWVASLCGYEEAHRNYAMLLEIPRRLNAHADACGQDSKREQAALDKLVASALHAAGMTELETKLGDAESAMQAAEHNLELEEDRHRQITHDRAAIDAGTDPWSLKALALLERRMEGEDMGALQLDAIATGTPRDDSVVASLMHLRGEFDRVTQDRERAQSAQSEALSRVSDLEEVRRRFRRERYDSQDSRFGGGLDSQQLLHGLLQGAVVLSEVFGQFRRNQQFRVRHPIPRPHHSTTSHSSGSSGGGGFGGSLSGGGSRSSSGGFRTGGGF